MSPRKPMSKLSPEDQEKRREYMREAKRKSREGKPPEIDKRTYADRSEYKRKYMRDYRAKLKEVK